MNASVKLQAANGQDASLDGKHPAAAGAEPSSGAGTELVYEGGQRGPPEAEAAALRPPRLGGV